MGAEAFQESFSSIFRRVLPRYFSGKLSSAVSLTGGWDTRMIMASQRAKPRTLPCYTFAGFSGETVDVQQARKVAGVVDQDYTLLRLQSDFLTNFAEHAEKTIYASDGNGNVCLTHEIYLNRLARQVAGIRVTGTFGSEVLRGMTTFKEMLHDDRWFVGELKAEIASSREQFRARKNGNEAPFAIFTEIPWKHAASFRLGNTQLPVRSPYLDKELIKLACICPPTVPRDTSAISFVRDERPELVKVWRGDSSGWRPAAGLVRGHIQAGVFDERRLA
jgi:asparagine synthase (glutamine-hydrolysing)